jgi:FlgD Ig-like domain
MKRLLLCSLMILSVPSLHSQGYYPLEIGNVWEYRDFYDSTYGWTDVALRDTTLPNGFKYTVIGNPGQTTGGRNYRQEGMKVYQFARYQTSDTSYIEGDFLEYDFSANVGDAIRVDYGPTDTTTTRLVDEGQTNWFGKQQMSWVFYETSKHNSVYVLTEVSDSLGMTYWGGEGGIAYRLWGAIIRGVTYGTLTGVRTAKEERAPSFELMQNFPNPFNPSTTIRFRLPTEEIIDLRIYDILGKEVRTLCRGRTNSGLQSVVWDGKNNGGTQVGSGFYFSRLQAGDRTICRKMILLR